MVTDTAVFGGGTGACRMSRKQESVSRTRATIWTGCSSIVRKA